MSFCVKMRTNSLFYLVFSILLSHISSVTIIPSDKIKAIWNSQQMYITCKRDSHQNSGTLKWYSNYGYPIDDNVRAPIYVQHVADSLKLFLINVPKKSSGTYECRHTLDGKTISSDKFELKVYNSIDMEGNKDTVVGTEGQSLSILCRAKFDSETSNASITWMFNNLHIKDGEGDYNVKNEAHQYLIEKKVKSLLKINRLTKENEGIYMCQASYGNDYLTDMKQIDINLRVQFKPRFPENTQKYVWVSNDSLSPIIVNLTCLVNADPPAEFQWLTGLGIPIRYANIGVKHVVYNTVNLSVLSLEYNNIDALSYKLRENPSESHRNFQCKALNNIGNAKHMFSINIGKLPKPPIIEKYSYENGILILTVNDTEVDPPIDIYQLNIDDSHQIFFNASNRHPMKNNTYELILDVPIGSHGMTIYAHNLVGWSEAYCHKQKLSISSSSASLHYLSLLIISILGAVYGLQTGLQTVFKFIGF